MKQPETKKIVIALSLVVVYFALLMTVNNMKNAEAVEGAVVTYQYNTSKNATPPDARQDNKGTITTVDISVYQQNVKWKAYVGNVTGTLVLRDADSYSIYEWPSGGDPSGEVYIARDSNVDWTSIQCANASSITDEQTTLGFTATAADNINNTFDSDYHIEFLVAETLINVSTCQALATYVNNTAQTFNQASENTTQYQEILLMDDDMDIVYATIINQNTYGYRDDSADNATSLGANHTYDFQALVPDYVGASIATYYFYVEIDG